MSTGVGPGTPASSSSGGVNPVGITGLVGITGAVGMTGFVGATIGNFPALFGITGMIGVSVSNTNFGVTGALGVSVSNFPSLYGITGPIGVSISNTNFGVTGALGVSIINTGVGVTFPILSVTFPIGFGVTFNNGVTFLQQSNIGITGPIGLTGLNFFTMGYTLGRTNVFKFSQSTTGSSAFIFLATFLPTAGTNFYLQGYYFDGGYATATGGVGWIGTVNIQSAVGGAVSTLMVHRLVNPTAGVDRVNIAFEEPPFFGNSTIIAIGVVPSQTNLITWTGNFWGYQK